MSPTRLWILVPALAALLVAGCSKPRSPFVRVTMKSGRIHYARIDRALHSRPDGFLTFRDVVTRETVRVKDGDYVAQQCPVEEVRLRQHEHMRDPHNLPRVPE